MEQKVSLIRSYFHPWPKMQAVSSKPTGYLKKQEIVLTNKVELNVFIPKCKKVGGEIYVVKGWLDHM